MERESSGDVGEGHDGDGMIQCHETSYISGKLHPFRSLEHRIHRMGLHLVNQFYTLVCIDI